MKRNKLITSRRNTRLFSSAISPSNKRRNLLALMLLTFTGVFITTIVLATNKPANQEPQSNVIDLPNLPAKLQNTARVTINKAGEDKKLPTLTHDDTISSALNAPIKSDDNFELAAIDRETDDTVLTTKETNIVETNELTTKDKDINWQEVTVKSGDNLSLIFPRVGLTARDVYKISQLGKDVKPLLNLKPGQLLRFDIEQQQDSKSLQKIQLILSPIKTLEVASSPNGFKVNIQTREYDVHQLITSGVIKNSLFGAGLNAGLSNKLIMQLAYIFGWDIDFALDLRKEDQFKVIYTENYLDGKKISDGTIQAAEFTNHGKTYKAIRYTDDTGESHYYSPTGESMRKAFIRTPVSFTRISSRFSLGRKHPILNKIRAHKGVDYAAPKGTPIKATGDGKIKFIGWKGGYGRVIILSHAGKYSTLYGHMSRFKKGEKRGQRVKQGDVIGYVGMSGLATGPHLHYEFRINGVHRNPLTVALPKADSLAKKYRSDFKQKAQPLLAQLDTIDKKTLALN